MSITLEENKITFENHNYKYDGRSLDGVVSSWWRCRNCGHLTYDPSTGANVHQHGHGECYTMEYKTLERPSYKWEYKNIVSGSQMTKAIEDTKKEILAFVKKFARLKKKYGFEQELTRSWISGTTSVSAQALGELINEGLITF